MGGLTDTVPTTQLDNGRWFNRIFFDHLHIELFCFVTGDAERVTRIGIRTAKKLSQVGESVFVAGALLVEFVIVIDVS
jgi:hypothetical protein